MKCTLLILALFVIGGCNLFSPFHDEGGSDNLEDIIGDVEAALERGEPGKAYEYATDGIKKFPKSVTLHYLGAVAVVQDAEIGFADFASMVRSDGDEGESFLDPLCLTAPAQGDTAFFFDKVSPNDLEAMAEAFNTSYGLLEDAVRLIEAKEATPEELADFGGDIQLGLGISGLLKAIFTVLDDTHDLDDLDGFRLNDAYRAFETEDGWGFSATVVEDVVCDARPWLRIAEEALYDHYRSITGDELPPDLLEDNLDQYTYSVDWVGRKIDEGTLTGEIFASVHNGIVDLYVDSQYECD